MNTDITSLKASSGSSGCPSVIIDKAQEAIAVIDTRGIVCYANLAWLKMHGFENGYLVAGKHISSFHSKEQFRTEVLPLLNEALSRGQISGPVEHIHKNGARVSTNSTIIVLKDKEGKVHGLIVFATDTTEIEQLKAEVRELGGIVDKKSAELAAMTRWQEDREKEMEMTEKLLFDRETEVSAACKQMTEYLAERKHTQEQLRILSEMLEKKEKQIAGLAGQLRQNNTEQDKLETRWKVQCRELTSTIDQLHNMVMEMKQREVEFLDGIDRDAEMVGANASLDQEQLRQLSGIAKKFASS